MLRTHLRWVVLLIAGFYVFPIYAATNDSTLTVTTVLTSISLHLPWLMRLVTACAFVMGMYLIVFGLLRLKQYGEARTQMSQEHKLKEPLVALFAGTMLLYLPRAVQVGMSTFWSTPSPYGYLTTTDQWSQAYNICYMVVQLFGTVAFVRGLVMLSHLGGHGGHQASFGKAMTHIIGGIFCINIYQVVQVVMITLGIQS